MHLDARKRFKSKIALKIEREMFRNFTCLDLPDVLLLTLGVNLCKTTSNMAGLKGLPMSIGVVLFMPVFGLPGISKSQINSANAFNVG